MGSDREAFAGREPIGALDWSCVRPRASRSSMLRGGFGFARPPRGATSEALQLNDWMFRRDRNRCSEV